MTITIELTDEQARAVIRATAVYGRELAANEDTKRQARELDEIRHDIERKVDTQVDNQEAT